MNLYLRRMHAERPSLHLLILTPMSQLDEQPNETVDGGHTRRVAVRTAAKGLALLPYVVPLLETFILTPEAQAQSPLQNDPPPPENQAGNSGNGNSGNT